MSSFSTKKKSILLLLVLVCSLSILLFIPKNDGVKAQIENATVQNYLKNLPYKEVSTLGAIGTPGHQSNDLKGDLLVITDIRDNYGSNLDERFRNYTTDFITYANDLFEVNHLTHYADYYSALAQSIKSENFPFFFVLRDKIQEPGRERFTAYALSSDGDLCYLPFDFFIPGDIDEGEDFYTSDSLFNHVTYYKQGCWENKKIVEVLNGSL